MWCNFIRTGHESHRADPMPKTLLTVVGIIAVAMGTASFAVAQEARLSEKSESDDSLVDSEAAVEGRPDRISDWALAGVVWSDAHLVRKLAQKEADQAEDPERIERMKILIEDSGQIIEILQDFGWRRLETRQAELAADAEAIPVEGEPVPPPAAGDEALEARSSRPAPGLPRRVETESPPGLNDPGVDDELQSPDVDFDLQRYRVDDYIDEVPAERRSLADAVEDGVEGALAAGIDNISGTYGVGRGAGRISQREIMTRSNTLPYSKDSIYDTDDFDPDADYDVNNPLTEPVPSDSNPLIENVEDEDLENRPVESPGAVPSDVPDIEGEDDFVRELATEGRVPESERGPAAATAVPDAADLRRFTEKREQFAQDAAWVQFQFDVNQRTWQILQAQPAEESLRRHLDAAIAQLQAHAQVGARMTDDSRLAAILRVIGGKE